MKKAGRILADIFEEAWFYLRYLSHAYNQKKF